MNLSKIIREFNNNAYSKKWQPSNLGQKRVNQILDLIGSKKIVLDVGCYDGTIAKQIESLGNKVVGIDIAKPAVEMAKKKGIKAFVYNLEEDEIPASIGKFDVIVAGELIEHIFDPDSFLVKLKALLKPKGYIILTTPNIAGLGSRLGLLLGKLPWMIENDIQPGRSGHIRYYNFFEIQKLLTRQKFKITDFRTDSIGLGSLNLPLLGNFLPNFGRILIIKAQKNS